MTMCSRHVHVYNTELHTVHAELIQSREADLSRKHMKNYCSPSKNL
jgi:hypothetical protein